MAKVVNFEIIQGDSFILNATYRDPQGTAIDLSSYDIVFQVRNDFGGSVICATVTQDDGIEIDPSTKRLTITLTPEQTTKFTVPKAAYQLKVTSGSGEATTLASGFFAVGKAVIV